MYLLINSLSGSGITHKGNVPQKNMLHTLI